MIEKHDCMRIVLRSVPEFYPAWKAHLEYWEGEEAGLSNDLSEFSHFVIENIKEMKDGRKKEIFSLVERLLEEGDREVKDAVATCFLENLLNASSSERLSPEDFVGFLGGGAKSYCKSWDEFTGVKTPGL